MKKIEIQVWFESKRNFRKNVWQVVSFNSRKININGTIKDFVFTRKVKCRTRNMTLKEMHGVKLQKKLDFIQNDIYKCRYEKLAVHLQWQKNWRVRTSLSAAEIQFLERVSCFEMIGGNCCQKMFRSFGIHLEASKNNR